mgnify:CR=1 FL=1
MSFKICLYIKCDLSACLTRLSTEGTYRLAKYSHIEGRSMSGKPYLALRVSLFRGNLLEVLSAINH